MKIICGRHSKPVRHICTLTSCRSNLLCEECLAAYLPHTHSHKPHILPLAQFLRISTCKGTIEHAKQVIINLQKFGSRLSAVRDSSTALQKAAEGELAALVRVF